jgi:GTPase involved in cell partitioning and DNA repair
VAAFDPEMASRPAVIALNKADLAADDAAQELAHAMRLRTGLAVFVVSARQLLGLVPLVEAIAGMLKTFNTSEGDVAGRV